MSQVPSTYLLIFIIVLIPTVSYAGLEAENTHFAMGVNEWHKWERVESIRNSSELLEQYCAYILMDYLKDDLSNITYTQINWIPVFYKYSKRNQTPHVIRLICKFQISKEGPIQSLGFIKGPGKTVFSVENHENHVILERWILLEYEAWFDVLKLNPLNRLAACRNIFNKFIKSCSGCVTETKWGLITIAMSKEDPRKPHTVLKCIAKNKTFTFIGTDQAPGNITRITVINRTKKLGKSEIVPDWNIMDT